MGKQKEEEVGGGERVEGVVLVLEVAVGGNQEDTGEEEEEGVGVVDVGGSQVDMGGEKKKEEEKATGAVEMKTALNTKVKAAIQVLVGADLICLNKD